MSSPSQPLRRTRRSLPIALLRARETVMGPIREMLSQSDINEQKWRVLRVLDERGPCELTQVAKDACLLLPSLTRIIRAMEEEGLASRSTDEVDRRKTIATITDAGIGPKPRLGFRKDRGGQLHGAVGGDQCLTVQPQPSVAG
jgi:homoprotocatechuate degradation regulator HpaR